MLDLTRTEIQAVLPERKQENVRRKRMGRMANTDLYRALWNDICDLRFREIMDIKVSKQAHNRLSLYFIFDLHDSSSTSTLQEGSGIPRLKDQ